VLDAHALTSGVMLAFLRLGKQIDHASSLLLIAAVLCSLGNGASLVDIYLLAALLLAIAQKYFAWRVALDVELFALLQQYPAETAVFDAALAACLGHHRELPVRSMAQRWCGARRLLQRQAGCFALQAACLVPLLFC
jgi:hypothetical protein